MSRTDPPATPVAFGGHAIEAVVYGALTLLGVAAATGLKGHLESISDYMWVVAISAVGVAISEFWASLLGLRFSQSPSVTPRQVWVKAKHAVWVMAPGLVMILATLGSYLIGWDLESSIDAGMCAAVILLFAVAWFGASRGPGKAVSGLIWGGLTALVGLSAVLFKVIV